jgi:hypothetical protein
MLIKKTWLDLSWKDIRDEHISKLKDITTTVTSGFIDDQVQSERLEICKDCSEYETTKRKCKICGCFMPLKTMFNAAECPKKYWIELTD